MSTPDSNSHVYQAADAQGDVAQQIRDISEVPAIEVITTAAVHLMSAAAVKLGLAAEDNAEELKDLDEARKLITALAGLVNSFRMMRIPEPEPSSAAEGMVLG